MLSYFTEPLIELIDHQGMNSKGRLNGKKLDVY